MIVEDDGAAAAAPAQWDTEIRVRALARLAQRPRRLPPFARIGALAILVALHALMLWRWYGNRFAFPPANPVVVQVRLIEESAPLSPPPPVPATPRRPHPLAAKPLPVTPQPMAAAILPAAAPQPKLFNRDGMVHLPMAPRFTAPLDRGLERGRELLARGHNLIHCRRSKFDNALTPAEMATAIARGAHMAHLVMGNPLDPLNDVGQQQAEDAAGGHAAEKREIEARACDD